MATISNIQGTAGSQLTSDLVVDKARHSPPESVSPPTPPTPEAPAESPRAPGSPSELDQEGLQDLAQQLQEAIDRASDLGHRVGFRLDQRIQDFVIEIRDTDGTLLKQYPPEKVLNLRQKLTELSGMVVDATT